DSHTATLMGHKDVAGFTVNAEALNPTALGSQSRAPDFKAPADAKPVIHLDGHGRAARVGKCPVLVLGVVKRVVRHAAPAFVAADIKIFLPDAQNVIDVKAIRRS